MRTELGTGLGEDGKAEVLGVSHMEEEEEEDKDR